MNVVFESVCCKEVETVEIRELSENVDDDVPERLVSLIVIATMNDLTEEERKERMRMEGGRCIETLFKRTQEGGDIRKSTDLIND